MSDCTSVIHLTHREGLSAVFPAQVARPMSLLRDRGFHVTLAVFSALGEYWRVTSRHRWLARREQIQRDFGLDIDRLPSPPSRARTLWDEGPVFRRWLKRRLPQSPQTVIHCRGAEAALIAHSATSPRNGVPIVFDCRGLSGPEYLLVNGYNSVEETPPTIRQEATRREQVQQRAAVISDGVICVSHAMKREIQRDWSIPAAKIRVIPCCTDVESGARAFARRTELRTRLGFDNRLVIAYCGSLGPWHMLPENMKILRSILQVRPDAHFFAITSSPQSISAIADRHGVRDDRRTIISVTHGEVPHYLAAADIGLLIRSKSKVNRVASPVKFAEYLACGVPVLLTDGIGDYADLVRREKVGCVLPDVTASDATMQPILTLLSQLDADPEGLRKRCQAVARARLDWHHAIEDVRGLYDQLVAGRRRP